MREAHVDLFRGLADLRAAVTPSSRPKPADVRTRLDAVGRRLIEHSRQEEPDGRMAAEHAELLRSLDELKEAARGATRCNDHLATAIAVWIDTVRWHEVREKRLIEDAVDINIGPARFRDRADAARQLAARLKGRDLRDPVVLAIPRGRVATGAVLARELGADLDVVLSRKLRAPIQPELAVGAVGEDGHVIFNPAIREYMNVPDEYLEAEKRHQLAEIARRKKLIRRFRPAVPLAGRSVVVADDGTATGSTMIAALQAARAENPHELIAAAPVGSPDRIAEVRRWCDDVVCLVTPEDFRAIAQFYDQGPVPGVRRTLLVCLLPPATALDSLTFTWADGRVTASNGKWFSNNLGEMVRPGRA